MGRTNYSAGFETTPAQKVTVDVNDPDIINSLIESLTTRVNEQINTKQNNDIATNKTNIETNKQSLSTLSATVGTNETTLTNLGTEVSGNKGHIASNAATLSTLRTDFDEANGRLTDEITRVDGRIDTALIGIDTETIAENADKIAQIIEDNSEVLNVVGRVGALENANTRTYANTYIYQALGEELLFSKVRSWGDALVVQASLESVINYVGDILFQFYDNNGFGKFNEANDQVNTTGGVLDLTSGSITTPYSHIFPYDSREDADVSANFNQSIDILRGFTNNDTDGFRFTNGVSVFTSSLKSDVEAAVHGKEITINYDDFISFYKAYGLLRYDTTVQSQLLNRTDGLLNISSIKFKVTTLPVNNINIGGFEYGGFVAIDDTSIPGTIQVTYDAQYTINATYSQESKNEVQLVPPPEQNPSVPALAVISNKFGDDDKVVDIVSGGTSHFSVTGSGKVDMRNGELRFGSATNDFEDNKFGGFTPELANVSAMFIQFPNQDASDNVIHKTYFDTVFSSINFDVLDRVGSGGTYTIPNTDSDPTAVVNSIDFTDPTGQLINSNIFAVSLDDGVVSVNDGTRVETGISDATNNGRLKGYTNTVRLPVWVLYNYALSGRIDRLNSRRLFLNTFVSRVKATTAGELYYEPLITVSNRITHFNVPVVDVPTFGDKKTEFGELASRLWRYYRLTSMEIKNRVKIVGSTPDVKEGDAYQIPPALEVRANHASPLDPIFTVKSDYLNEPTSLFAVMGDGRLQGVTAIGTKDDRVNTIFMNSEIVFNEKLKFSAANENNKVLQVDTDGSMLLGSNKAIDIDENTDVFSFVKTNDNDLDTPTTTGFADIQASGLIIGNYKLAEVNGELVVQKLNDTTKQYSLDGVLRAGGIGVGNEFTVAKNNDGNITVNNGNQEMMALVSDTVVLN